MKKREQSKEKGITNPQDFNSLVPHKYSGAYINYIKIPTSKRWYIRLWEYLT
jgi:hypothetical protein